MSTYQTQFVSDGSLLIAIILLLGFFYLVYTLWDILFYIAVLILATSIVRRFFAKVNGIPLSKGADRMVFGLTDRVASEIGISRINEIILTPDSGIGVGGVLNRRLLLGIATLNEIDEDDLYNILFHEFAHIKGADNIIGTMMMGLDVAIRDLVQLAAYSMFISVLGLVMYLPTLLFYYIYTLITLAHSRAREYQADHVAATFVGGERFGASLEKYVKASEEFGYKINAVLNFHAQRRMLPDNLYAAYRAASVQFSQDSQERMSQYRRMTRQVTSPFSTHPALESRLKQVSGIKGTAKGAGSGKAANMISDMQAREKELTKIIYKNNRLI